jgi:hypothetical protein
MEARVIYYSTLGRLLNTSQVDMLFLFRLVDIPSTWSKGRRKEGPARTANFRSSLTLQVVEQVQDHGTLGVSRTYMSSERPLLTLYSVLMRSICQTSSASAPHNQTGLTVHAPRLHSIP